MTWGEMPSAYAFNDVAMTRFTREWIAAIQRDISHPCLVAWVPTNESWGVPDLENDPAQRAYIRSLADIARALDSSRPVISNDGWEHTNSDILAMHDYTDNRETLIERWVDAAAVANTIANVTPGSRRMIVEDGNNPEAPLMLTEVGGIGYPNVPGERWHFWSADTPAQLRNKYAELIGAILESDTVTGFCYTQLTDTMQEKNGPAGRRAQSEAAAGGTPRHYDRRQPLGATAVGRGNRSVASKPHPPAPSRSRFQHLGALPDGEGGRSPARVVEGAIPCGRSSAQRPVLWHQGTTPTPSPRPPVAVTTAERPGSVSYRRKPRGRVVGRKQTWAKQRGSANWRTPSGD